MLKALIRSYMQGPVVSTIMPPCKGVCEGKMR